MGPETRPSQISQLHLHFLSFCNGNSTFFPLSAESQWTQSGQLSGVELRRPAQASMSVLLEAGGSDVLLMALIGHCISLQLSKLCSLSTVALSVHRKLLIHITFWEQIPVDISSSFPVKHTTSGAWRWKICFRGWKQWAASADFGLLEYTLKGWLVASSIPTIKFFHIAVCVQFNLFITH